MPQKPLGWKPMTVGEKFERDGPCVIMATVVKIAEALKRIPVHQWDYRFTSDPEWRLCINGSPAVWTPPDLPAIAPWEGAIEWGGWLVALFNSVGGTAIGKSEDDIIAALEREVQQVQTSARGGQK